MIRRFRVENYKALSDVLLELTPIHVLIGPNDSGKTSILEALAALCRSTDQELWRSFTGSWAGRGLVWHRAAEPAVTLSAGGEADEDRWEYRLTCRFGAQRRQAVVSEEYAEVNGRPYLAAAGYAATAIMRSTVGESGSLGEFDQIAPLLHDQLSGVRYHRWVPRLLSLPVAPDSRRRFRMETSGFGLALCLDDILGNDRSAFSRMEEQFRSLFPQVRSIKLLSEPAFKAAVDDPEQIPRLDPSEGKGLHLEYRNGSVIPAAQLSDGVLLVLAYLAILHSPEPPRVLLVEEPENGIHPQRLGEVLRVLRSIVDGQQHTQVLLTTHSPYVVDLFAAEEVTLCRMQEDGSVAVRRLSDSALVREQARFFTLGEIWTGEGDQVLAESKPARPVSAK
jgi:predicted ATPase